MPKRSAEEKINYYHEKIRKLQAKQNRHVLIQSPLLDSEINLEIGTRYNDTPPPQEPEFRSPTPSPPPSVPRQISPEQTFPSPPHVLPVETVSPMIDLDQEPEPELDPELLKALGDASEDTPAYGPDIHGKLAQRWIPILKKGLVPESKEMLLKEYAIPDNCRLLKAPTVNPELLAAITDVTKNRDKKILTEQDQLGLGITAINRAMSLLLTQGDKVQAVKILSDGCRILTDLHYAQTQLRKKLITRGLDKSSLAVMQDQDRDETLFGKELSEKIKASKAIERQGLQIKKAPAPKPSTSNNPVQPSVNRSRYQGNWSGPPRFQASTRGGRGANYRNQYRRAPQQMLPTAPPQSARPMSSITRRAPTRQ